MVDIRPFTALRPDPVLASKICELPYDVLSSDEARHAVSDNPLSFFHVSKPEIDFPPGTDPYLPQVYQQAQQAFQKLIEDGALLRDEQPYFYLYRQIMGAHSQLGLVAVASCQDYLDKNIRKHELTRPDKEDDRVRHIETLSAQTGPVFLLYRAQPNLDTLLTKISQETPEVDFVASDGVQHTGWIISDRDHLSAIKNAWQHIPRLYIADGHHRCAAAARVYQSRRGAGGSGYFLSVIFPHTALQILPYHRVLKDLNGRSGEALAKEMDQIFEVVDRGSAQPAHPHEVGFYLNHQWRSLRFLKHLTANNDPFERLDVTLLQKHVLSPLFGIEDPRTSQRIQFVGGIRGTAELERLVDSGEGACAFALYPTGIEELMAIADADGIMPPKSTWFEPKLRDAMFTHLI